MLLSLVTPPAGSPISLQDAKAQARVELGEEDILIQGFIEAATQYAEWYTQRALMEQTYELYLDCWPRDSRSFEIPRPPLLELDEITYLDSSGNEATLDTEDYKVVAPQGPRALPARVILKAGKRWPLLYPEEAAVTVRFSCGYGDQPDDVPHQIRTAIAEHVAELYEHRESSVLAGAVLQQAPFSVDTILWPFRVTKL